MALPPAIEYVPCGDAFGVVRRFPFAIFTRSPWMKSRSSRSFTRVETRKDGSLEGDKCEGVSPAICDSSAAKLRIAGIAGLPPIPFLYRLRVVVAAAAFPKYDRNLNTGGDNERDTRYVVVRQRILHDKAHPSFVRLPIIPR